jgi:maltose acetyltransferase-like protein
VATRERARDLCQNLKATREFHQIERRQILTELVGKGGFDRVDATAQLY